MKFTVQVRTEGWGDNIHARVRKMRERKRQAGSVEIGFFPVARYPDGRQVALVAAVNEFTRTPFMRNAIRVSQARVRTIFRKDWPESRKLNEIGRLLRDAIEKEIRSADLIDTAEMIESVEFDVVLRP